MRRFFLFSLTCLILCPQVGQSAPNEPETYSRIKLAVGGYFYSGNVNQVQSNLQGHYGLSAPGGGLDVLFNGYRLWAKDDPDSDYEITGDDLYITAIPFWYFSDRFYLGGLARFESSQSMNLNARYMGGGGLGYTPIRSKEFLVRCSIMPTYEFATFDGEEFRIDVDHDGPDRSIMRLAIMSNGWYQMEDAPVALRYFAQFFPNPTSGEDLRLNVTGNIDFQLSEHWAFQTTIFVNHDAAVLTGREPTDVRSTFGFAWNTQ